MANRFTTHEQRVEAFWRNVVKTDECWLWTGALWKNGYGKCGHREKFGSRYAHIFAWVITHGPVPQGLWLDHLCRVHHCVRPSHMEPTTPKENVLRGIGLTAINAAKEKCPTCGSKYALYTRTDGRYYRRCLPCKNLLRR